MIGLVTSPVIPRRLGVETTAAGEPTPTSLAAKAVASDQVADRAARPWLTSPGEEDRRTRTPDPVITRVDTEGRETSRRGAGAQADKPYQQPYRSLDAKDDRVRGALIRRVEKRRLTAFWRSFLTLIAAG